MKKAGMKEIRQESLAMVLNQDFLLTLFGEAITASDINEALKLVKKNMK